MFRAERKKKKKNEKKGAREAGASESRWILEEKKFERVKMFLAWCIMDALRANIMRFYSAIHIKHRKQQKAGAEGRNAIKMPTPKHIISTPSSRTHSPRDAPDLRPSTLAAPIIIPGLFFTISKPRIMHAKLQCMNEEYRYVIRNFPDASSQTIDINHIDVI